MSEELVLKNLKDMDTGELTSLCSSLRGEILSATKSNGGHLSSNLGIVETTVALHRVFSFPEDKIIFDVGHQCYAHKILSGRGDFSAIRTKGGMSGFPDPDESEYDAFGTGHAGTSIAAALGLCAARDKRGEDFAVIAVVGDGAFSNGLNLEALTVSEKKPKNLIVILNDNGMSISKNKNGLYRSLSKSTIKGGYVKSKKAIKRIFGNSFITKFFKGIRNFFRRIINKDDFFYGFGFKYVGVVDGNDLTKLLPILERVKTFAKDKAVLLHVSTVKGKGMTDAENRADEFHGVGKEYKVKTGGFACALGETLVDIIGNDDKVVSITAGMKDGTGLKKVEEAFPNNFYDVGIAEEYAVTFAAGLSKGGLKPVVAIYSTFMQRAYDELIHDVCMQNLPVVFCLDRAGFVGEDGKTHQGLFDLSFSLSIPNLTVLAPNGKKELKDALLYALSLSSPVLIRYPKDCGEDCCDSISEKPFAVVKDADDYDTTLIAVGPRMKKIALSVAEKDGKIRVVSARRLKPVDSGFISSLKPGTTVITLEENAVIGGFGAYLSGFLTDKKIKLFSFGAKDGFVPHGTVKEQIESSGITAENIEKTVNSAR